ncbi:MAG: prepilin-type N-terminal cleavage/methylation domain-containing protein, partial [Candidatus Delongbacteria bacterium]|nr:prepilin-type N-terminal cleavage/methylation domain-containing protein [Candidatus Delongbacteria bacterium]
MKKGFTLIEVLVVAVIVAILAAVAIPAYTAYIKSTKLDVAKNLAATIVSSAAVYYSKYPTAGMSY